MKRYAIYLILWLVFLLPSSLPAFTPQYQLGQPSNYDFAGEELHYKLYWTIFHVANAKTRVEKTIYQGRPAYLFYDSASTAGLVVLFKRIHDWAKSFWDIERRISLFLEEHQEEGHYRKIKTYVFDYTKGKVIHTNESMDGKEQHVKVTPILAKFFCDTHSAVYFFRKYGRFEVGATTIFPICTGTKFANVRLKVVSKEWVKTPWGKVETFKIEPSSELNVKGVFSRRGKVYVWLTTDLRHIPVKVKAKVKIGSVRAVLVKAKFGHADEGKAYR